MTKKLIIWPPNETKTFDFRGKFRDVLWEVFIFTLTNTLGTLSYFQLVYQLVFARRG